MYITERAGTAPLFVCLGKVKSDALPHQLVAFARCLHETLPIQYRNLLSAALNQTGTFQLCGSIRDGWPRNAFCARSRARFSAIHHATSSNTAVK
jgi:hypothetical protein